MNTEELARSYTSLTRAMQRFPKAPWNDALSHPQMQSKAWAVDELAKARRNIGVVYIVGGWLGLLGPLMFAHAKLKINKVRSFDIDPSCQQIADQVNIEKVVLDWHYKAVTKDMLTIDYVQHMYEIDVPGGHFDSKNTFTDNKPSRMCETPDTIINTSCDDIADFSKWWDMIPKGKLVLLQNNNFRADDKTSSTIRSLQHLIDQAPMVKTMFCGERDYSKYRAFMLIGVK